MNATAATMVQGLRQANQSAELDFGALMQKALWAQFGTIGYESYVAWILSNSK